MKIDRCEHCGKELSPDTRSEISVRVPVARGENSVGNTMYAFSNLVPSFKVCKECANEAVSYLEKFVDVKNQEQRKEKSMSSDFNGTCKKCGKQMGHGSRSKVTILKENIVDAENKWNKTTYKKEVWKRSAPTMYFCDDCAEELEKVIEDWSSERK